MGIDIVLSELLQNSVVSSRFFFVSASLNNKRDVTSKNLNFHVKQFFFQSFGPGELSYTFVIETNTGQALVHPQLPEPEEIQEDPVVIMISDMETSPGKIQS